MTNVLLELAAAILGDLVEDVVFVGGATLELMTTDPGAPSPRGTDDVDVVVQASTRGEYEVFAERLRMRGMSEDMDSRVICRWRGSSTDLVLDMMPTAARVFGMANRWYVGAVQTAQSVRLPSGAVVRVITAPYLLATKFEAFADRGRGDIYGSRDLMDIVTLLDRRPELSDEIDALGGEVRAYLREQAAAFLARRDIGAMLEAHVEGDAESQARVSELLIPRLQRIAR